MGLPEAGSDLGGPPLLDRFILEVNVEDSRSIAIVLSSKFPIEQHWPAAYLGIRRQQVGAGQ